ncbi:MAG: DUF805 domain-containing protein [Alphaproteobacteria bacterium]
MQPASLNQLIAYFIGLKGRTTRQEYLLGLAFLFTVNAAIINYVLGQASGPVEFETLFLITLPLLPSQIIITVRRCHDIGLPGAFVLLFLVPFAGFFWMAALAMIPGNAAANVYGPPPRYRQE